MLTQRRSFRSTAWIGGLIALALTLAACDTGPRVNEAALRDRVLMAEQRLDDAMNRLAAVRQDADGEILALTAEVEQDLVEVRSLLADVMAQLPPAATEPVGTPGAEPFPGSDPLTPGGPPAGPAIAPADPSPTTTAPGAAQPGPTQPGATPADPAAPGTQPAAPGGTGAPPAGDPSTDRVDATDADTPAEPVGP
jgi:hypothetical protein